MGEQKFTNLQIEDVKLGETYAISINPSDHYQFFKMKDREGKFVESSAVILKKILSHVKYTMKLETSSMGRLHWHGTMRYESWSDIKGFYINNIPRLKEFGVFKISSIEDTSLESETRKYKTWNEYCTKQSKHFDNAIDDEYEEEEEDTMSTTQKKKMKNLMKVFSDLT